MCGIFWSIINEQQVEPFIQGFQRLQHRGPDNSSYLVKGNHFLGTHRLAIINTSPEGNQPLCLGNTTLVCNGQIYNYEKLAADEHMRTDVDVILHLLEAGGRTLEEVAYALDGDFAFVALREGVIQIARDPIGVRPLFYGADDAGNVVCAASEVKAIRDLPGVATCRVFPPGHVYDSVTKEFRRYTDIYCDAELEANVDALEVVRNGIMAAVKKRIENTDRPLAFLCSGGIDSSIVLAAAYELLAQEGKEHLIHVFSIAFDDGGKTRSDDAFYARMLVQQYGVKHTAVTFTWSDVEANIESIAQHIETYDPQTIRASVPMYMLAKYIKEHTDFKVILSGEGADELFMGYNIFMRAPDGEAANLETQRLIRNIHMFDGLRADRCFNAHGLEIRVPFLDIALVRSVFRIPGAHKMYQQGREKALLRDAFAHVPQLISSRVLDRGKERFSDGCGFGYVPRLLSYWEPNASDLGSKEKREKEVYGRWFDSAYPNLRHLIIARQNPVWAVGSEGAAATFAGF